MSSIAPLAEQVRLAERYPGIREAAHYMMTVNDGSLPPKLRQYPYLRPGNPSFREAMATVRDCAIFRLWAQSKIVYAMDDYMLADLSESSVSSIPTEIFRGLPHANPYVLLPQPDLEDLETAYYRTHIGVPWGAFVFGRYRSAELMCSTRDERREDLGLMFTGFLEREGPVAPAQLRCTMPLRGPMISVEQVVSATVAGFHFNEHLGEDDPSRLEAWLRTYVAQVFNSLVYICTDQPDVQGYRPGVTQAGKLKKSARRRQRRPRSNDINEIVKIGFRLGPALFEARQRGEQRGRERSSTGTGVRQQPHRRRGRYQTYWTGPGRKVPIVNWVAPYWVSLDLLDEQGPETAVVRRVRKRS